MMQKAVDDLCRIAPKLAENLGLEQIAAAQTCIESLVLPLSADGLNWSILHVVEAAPEWPL